MVSFHIIFFLSSPSPDQYRIRGCRIVVLAQLVLNYHCFWKSRVIFAFCNSNMEAVGVLWMKYKTGVVLMQCVGLFSNFVELVDCFEIASKLIHTYVGMWGICLHLCFVNHNFRLFLFLVWYGTPCVPDLTSLSNINRNPLTIFNIW